MTGIFPRPYLIVDNTRPVNALFDPSTLVGMVYLNALVPPPESDFENWEKIMADLKAQASK
jgi:hypothetical protein